MIITVSGKSASGKTDVSYALEKIFPQAHDINAKNIVSYTTRAPREGEVDGVDYHFITQEKFLEMVDNKEFAEHEEYSGGRFYGTAKADVIAAAESKDAYIAVLTPGGVRAFEKVAGESIFKVYVDAPDAVRVKRYIDRVGAEKMTSAELSECFERVQRDLGMFQGFDQEVDLVIDNSADSKHPQMTINSMASDIANICIDKGYFSEKVFLQTNDYLDICKRLIEVVGGNWKQEKATDCTLFINSEGGSKNLKVPDTANKILDIYGMDAILDNLEDLKLSAKSLEYIYKDHFNEIANDSRILKYYAKIPGTVFNEANSPSVIMIEEKGITRYTIAPTPAGYASSGTSLTPQDIQKNSYGLFSLASSDDIFSVLNVRELSADEMEEDAEMEF